MTQQPPSPYAAVGLAGQMGCLMTILAIGALLLGLGIEHVLNTKQHLITLACVLLSVPINLFIVLKLTQVMIKRLIPSTLVASRVRPSADSADDETN